MKWNFLSKGIKSENHDNQYTIYVYTILAGVVDIAYIETYLIVY